jgi:DNA-binding FadR family transcriptional regulator
MSFGPLEPRQSAVDACAAAIRRAILGGELAVGSRLPPERELAASFGVNRVTVRSALGKLATARLLSVRQGSGYLVLDFRREGGPELIPGLSELAGAADLADVARDLLLVRRQLARAVLERLAERHDDAACDAIRAAVERFSSIAERGADTREVARADLDVVAAILDATHSAVLRLCHNPVLAVVSEMPELCDAIYAEPEQSIEGYRALLAWLEAPRADLVDGIVGELARRDAATLSRLQRSSNRKNSR